MADMLNYLAYAKMMEQPDLGNTFATGLKAGSDVALTQTKNAIAQQGLAEERAFQEAAASGDWEKAAAINPQKAAHYWHGKYWGEAAKDQAALGKLRLTNAEKEEQLTALKYLDDTFKYVTKENYPNYYEDTKQKYPKYIAALPTPEYVNSRTNEEWEFDKANALTKGRVYQANLTGDYGLKRSQTSMAGRLGAANIAGTIYYQNKDNPDLIIPVMPTDPRPDPEKWIATGAKTAIGKEEKPPKSRTNYDAEGNPFIEEYDAPTGTWKPTTGFSKIKQLTPEQQHMKNYNDFLISPEKQANKNLKFSEYMSKKGNKSSSPTIKWDKNRPPTPDEAARLLRGESVD